MGANECRSELAISSLEQEADSLPTLSSDTRQLSLLSGIDIAAKSCESEPPKDGSPGCTCGKATSDCSIHPNTPEKWIASMRDSLAKILALPENKQGLAKKRAVASTVKSSASLALFDPATSSLRTLQQSFLTDSERSSLILPRSGMTRNGYVYELPIVGRSIIVIDGGVFPTVTATANQLAPSMQSRYAKPIWPTPNAAPLTSDTRLRCSGDGRKKPNKLGWAIAVFPTPNASDHRDRGNLSMPSIQRRSEIGKQLNLSMVVSEVSGALNPNWVEWLMGWPVGWTGLKQSETDKSRCKPQSHGDCSEASK
jgi:hypothetical protein